MSKYRGPRFEKPEEGETFSSEYDMDSDTLYDPIQRDTQPLCVQTIDLSVAGSRPVKIPGRAWVPYFFVTNSTNKQRQVTGLINVSINNDSSDSTQIFPGKHNRGFRGSFTQLTLTWKAQSNTSVDFVILRSCFTPWMTDDVDPITGAPPTGPAGGDLSGTYPNPSVAFVAGVAAATIGATIENLENIDTEKGVLFSDGGDSQDSIQVDSSNFFYDSGVLNVPQVNTTTLDVADINDQNNVLAIDVENRVLYREDGEEMVVDFENLIMLASGGSVVDWGNQILNDPGNTPSINWSNRTTGDSFGNLSLDYGARQLLASDGSLNLDWSTPNEIALQRVGQYIGQSLSGQGLTTDIFSVDFTALSGSAGPNNITSSAPGTGLYRISYYMVITTAGTSGTMLLGFGYIDDQGSRTQNATALNIAVAGGFVSGTFVVQAKIGTAIVYANTLTGVAGALKYSLYITMERF